MTTTQQKNHAPADGATQKKATLYRMVMDKHTCPYGIKSKDLLEREGFEVEDHHLTSRDETDAFLEKHDVKTTPQSWINGERVGGYDDLREHFDRSVTSENETTYRPVIGISSPISLLIGGIGVVSIIKAVYIEKRELKCACVGGNSNVPLGFVSLTESLMMVAMGTWMAVKETL